MKGLELAKHITYGLDHIKICCVYICHLINMLLSGLSIEGSKIIEICGPSQISSTWIMNDRYLVFPWEKKWFENLIKIQNILKIWTVKLNICLQIFRCWDDIISFFVAVHKLVSCNHLCSGKPQIIITQNKNHKLENIDSNTRSIFDFFFFRCQFLILYCDIHVTLINAIIFLFAIGCANWYNKYISIESYLFVLFSVLSNSQHTSTEQVRK